MENNQEILRVLENQSYIIFILASLCGIKIFLGIFTILYLFFPNIESAMTREKIKLEMEDMDMKICIDTGDEDQLSTSSWSVQGVKPTATAISTPTLAQFVIKMKIWLEI